MFIKSFIYLTIIVIIATLYNADLAQTKSYGADSELVDMDFSPVNVPEFESPISRMRRAIKSRRVGDESDIPKAQLYTGSHIRNRRQTAPGEPDVPQELENDFQLNRAKRQMPSPPADIPMPPM